MSNRGKIAITACVFLLVLTLILNAQPAPPHRTFEHVRIAFMSLLRNVGVYRGAITPPIEGQFYQVDSVTVDFDPHGHPTIITKLKRF